MARAAIRGMATVIRRIGSLCQGLAEESPFAGDTASDESSPLSIGQGAKAVWHCGHRTTLGGIAPSFNLPVRPHFGQLMLIILLTLSKSKSPAVSLGSKFTPTARLMPGRKMKNELRPRFTPQRILRIPGQVEGQGISRLNLVLRRVPHINDVYFIPANCKQHAVFPPSPSVQQFTDLLGEFIALGGEGATAGIVFERSHRLFQGVVLFGGCVRRLMLRDPSKRFADASFSRRIDDDAVCHASRGMAKSRRMSANTSSAGLPSPARISSSPCWMASMVRVRSARSSSF